MAIQIDTSNKTNEREEDSGTAEGMANRLRQDAQGSVIAMARRLRAEVLSPLQTNKCLF